MTNIMQSNNLVTKSDQKKLSKSELIKLLLKHNERIEKKKKSKFKGLFLLPEKAQDRWFKNIKTASFHNHHNS